MNINLIGVPIMYGCDKVGVEEGPDRLREYGILDIFKSDNHNIYDLGNIYVPPMSQEDKYKDHDSMKYLNPLLEVNTDLAHATYSSLEAGFFPLAIGGDHSLGMGTIAGASKHYKNMAVIWIDAHGDLNTPETSPSGNIHGMPLGASLGVGYDKMVNLYHEGQKVKAENVYIIGARDLDQGEVDLIQKEGINLYSMDRVRDRGLDSVLDEVIESIKSSKLDGVHLSFDIDVLDKSIVPGTGTPVAYGFTIEEAKESLEKIIGQGFITSMDFVEFNPKLDNSDGITAKISLDLLRDISRLL